MVWHIIKYWASFFIPAFYRRIQAKNIKNLQVKDPVIIAMNHPNAFTDPIAITYVAYPLRTHYIARGDAFKPGFAAWILEQIGLVPIFRLQDAGKEGLLKNDDSYRRVNALLAGNAKIIVFAEGICVQERRLRPLKKGVARMVFGAYQLLKSDTLRVIPVGVNYSHPNKFRSDVFYNVGEPIFVKDFMGAWQENPARAQKQFLGVLEPAMKKLVTHINDPKNDEAVFAFEKLCKYEWLKKQGLKPGNLADEFEVVTQITEKVNNASVEQPALLEEFKAQSSEYLGELKKYRLKDGIFRTDQDKKNSWITFVARLIVIILFSPIYLAGLAANLLPLLIVRTMTGKLVKTREFYSSFAIGFAMIIFPLTYVAWFLVFYFFYDSGLKATILCCILPLCGAFCLWTHPFITNTVMIFRVLRSPLLARRLREMRKNVHSLINKF